METASDGCGIPFQLEPFVHQVGGHSSMLQLDEKTICKPLIANELKFYQNAPDSLKAFMPEFKGIAEVQFCTDGEGYLCLTTYLPVIHDTPNKCCKQNRCQEKVENKIKHRIRVSQSGNIQIESNSGDGDQKAIEECIEVSEQPSNSKLNPWVLKCHQEHMNKIRNTSVVFSQKYILLENLAAKCEFPCILDIKMGTRPYGDDATDEKRQGLLAKAVSTTSISLGIRICGIQVYQEDSGHYICHNKYYGRGLTIDGIHQALCHFLPDERDKRYSIISQLLKKLCDLQMVINSLDTFRFFTGSLLIIYNGKKQTCSSIRDSDCLMRELCDDGNMNRACESASLCLSNSNEHRPTCQRLAENVQSEHNEICDKCEGNKENLVDVRMIDFAHSTQNQMFNSQNVHIGPDDGYLFGLENLIKQLKAIQEK